MSDKKEAFLEEMKKKLDDLNYRWNIERNKLEARAQHEGADARKAFEEKKEKLRQVRAEMTAKIKALEAAGENAWDDVKGGAEEAWKALNKAFEKVASHFKK